ncbi:MAG: hypothetical protein L0241_22710 [Planctomycetia bacterium]|nr:hypothetical protein [Planctomycetia bacterium]
MSMLIRLTGLLGLFLVTSAPVAQAATQKEIDRAIKGGTDALKAKYSKGGAGVGVGGGEANQYGIGGACLAGLALLEANIPANDPAVKTITAIIRDASYSQASTYQIALCLLYLDRLGDANDVPLIQMLAVRLLAGQTLQGGWGYQCISPVSGEDSKRLRAMKANQPAGSLHPEIKQYAEALGKARAGSNTVVSNDDNSNTQFAVIGVWAARKHGIPNDWMEDALIRIEKRYMATQDARTGNWPYSGPAPGAAAPQMPGGSPSMYCAGLIGMATSIARREERRKPDPPPAGKGDKPPPKSDSKFGDPFGNPGGKEPAKKPPARPADARDLVVQRAFAGLGLTMVDQIRTSGSLLAGGNGGHGTGDLYFLWSLERVGVIYGVDKIGGLDWYDIGSTAIVRTQGADGTWGRGGYGTEVNTAFAVLFLCKSNLARDLSSKVQRDPTSTEMRAGTGPSAIEVLPNRPTTPIKPAPVLTLPNPTNDESVTMASNLLKANGDDWKKLLTSLRDTKGEKYTRALVLATPHLEGDRKNSAREALAERLCRMTPDTLRAMLKAKEAELRRAAALACAMKDDKDHIPDLIEMLTDEDDSVVRAAKAGLKSLTGKDFGPALGASSGQKALAAAAWREWYAKEKK